MLFMVVLLFLGNNCGSVCEDDSGRFKKDSSRRILSFLGCLHSEAEVESSFLIIRISLHVQNKFIFLVESCSLLIAVDLAERTSNEDMALC